MWRKIKMTEKNIETLPLPKCGFYLNAIYFYLTQGCNLRCRHCWIEPEYQGATQLKSAYIPIDLIKKIVEQGKPLGLASVKLTGGEPLIHPDIKAILHYLSQTDLRLLIESNGVLCTKEIVDLVKKSKSPMVSISLDSPEPEVHEWVRGVKGSFDKAVSGLKNLVSANIDCQIIMSVMKKNVHHIEPLVRFAEELGVPSVKFNLVNPTARGKEMHDRGETLPVHELIETGKWVENTLSKSTNIDLIYSQPVAFQPLSRIYGDSSCGLCGIKRIMGVLGTGKYALCGIGETVKEMVFGDAKTDSLEEIWNNNNILNDIRSGLPNKLEGICADCLNKKLCLGSCIASNYYQSQNLFSPFWFCDEAYRNGLFPHTRKKPLLKADK